MTVETVTQRVVLEASLPKPGQQMSLRLLEGADTEDADTIEDVVRQLLASAHAKSKVLPRLSNARPGTLVLEVLGGPVGTKPLAQLLPAIVERAVADPDTHAEDSLRNLHVRALWTRKVDSGNAPVLEQGVRDKDRSSSARTKPRKQFAKASLGNEARNILDELDATAKPFRGRLARLLSQLDDAREYAEEDQQQLVQSVNMLLLRLGTHLACPTCGRPSVLEYRKPQPSSRYAGGIVAAHALAGDRSKHAPESWVGTSAIALVPRLSPEP